jgi:hypothetical protein
MITQLCTKERIVGKQGIDFKKFILLGAYTTPHAYIPPRVVKEEIRWHKKILQSTARIELELKNACDSL